LAALSLMLAALMTTNARADVPRAIARLRAATGCQNTNGFARYIGRHFGDDLTGPFDETVAPDGRYVQVVHKGPLRSASGYDGSTAWSQDFSGGSHRLDADDAHALAQTDAWLLSRGWCHSDATTAYTAYGEHDSRQGPVTVVSVTPRGGSSATLWIDVASGLLDRVEQQLNEERRITTYADWRTVLGRAVPFSWIVDYPEDQSEEHFELDRIDHAGALPPGTFAMPSLPRDFKFVTAETFTTVPLSLEGDKPIVDVRINGVGPLPFELDTGGHFIVTPATVRRLRLSTIGHGQELGQGTRVASTRFARVADVRLGNAQMTDQVAVVVPVPAWKLDRGTKPPLAGILGLGLFERFAVTFDPRRPSVTLRSLARSRPMPSGLRLPITFDEDAPLTPCTIDGRAGPCMIDTGNAGYTIVEHHWAVRNGLLGKLRRGLRDGDFTVERSDIGLGPILLPHELIEYDGDAVRGSESTTVEAGILSEALLDRFEMAVDYGRGAVWLYALRGTRRTPFDRVGLIVSKRSDGAFEVARLLPCSPASNSRLHVHDVITAVNGKPSSFLSRAQFNDLKVGPIGSAISLQFHAVSSNTVQHVSVRLHELLR